MIDRAQQAADAIDSVAALTAHQARSVLNEYTKDDLIAAIATGHGGQAGPGGTATVKQVVVGIDHTDINATTGFADLYLLPENETLLVCAPVICTEAFDGATASALPFEGSQAAGPSGATTLAIGDTFSPNVISAATDGLLFAGPPDNVFVLANIPCVTPAIGGGPVQLVVDFAPGDVPLNSIGTQGHIDVHLIIAVTP